MIQVGLQEVPRCPESITKRLQEFDRRLRCVFHVRERCWQIQEHLENSGQWSHVLFWHDGPWDKKEFRALPHSAEPLIVEILKRDFQRTSGARDVTELVKQLDEHGANERARRLEQANAMARDKMRRYAEWAYERAHVLQRRYAMGGRSRTRAINERLAIMRELGLRKDG